MHRMCDRSSPPSSRRGPAIWLLTAVTWLVVAAMVGLLVLLWRYTVQTESGTPWLGYIFSGAASLLIGLVLVIAAVGALQIWRGEPFGLHSLRVLVTFGGVGCAVMLVKGISALFRDHVEISFVALVCFAAGVGIALAFNVLLRHESVTSWCAPIGQHRRDRTWGSADDQ
ncbi:MAG TPA: hypothetical protein VIL34_16440 [Actinopolymorphaceae bacterium]